MRFGYGLITAQRPPDDPRSDADIYREAVELSVLAEDCGFDSVWVSEHHFVDDGYMPSLLITAAAIAQATTSVEIGTAVLLAPLYDPLRLAEDAATVDLISGGRFTLGIGAGWREEEFDHLRIPMDDRAARMRDTVAVLRGAWSGKAFSYKGKTIEVDNAFVSPQPAHKIPILMGGFVDAAIRRSGRIGDGFLGSSSGTSGIEGFRRARELVREGLEASGRSESDFQFILHVPVFAWDDADAWDTVKPYYQYLRWKYPDMGAKRGSSDPGMPPALTPEEEAKLRPTIICGTAAEVVDQIGAFKEALGADTHFICRSYFSGMDYEMQRRSIEILGSSVFPSLR